LDALKKLVYHEPENTSLDYHQDKEKHINLNTTVHLRSYYEENLKNTELMKNSLTDQLEVIFHN
jgi:hypothetical protein